MHQFEPVEAHFVAVLNCGRLIREKACTRFRVFDSFRRL